MGFFSNWLKANSYKEQRSGIEFPGAIGSFKRGEATPYEAEPGKPGVAIEYGSEEAAVTIYVRAAGNPDHETSEEFLKDNLAAIKTLEERGTYSNVKLYQFDADKERPGWRSAAFTSRTENQFLVSFIYCKVATGYLVKIRATTGDPKNETLQSFIKALQEVVDKAGES
ncbi:hypothetical protein BH09VER1_BH09VER1_18270 [soil metagenome]